jgi:hypothetical protein
VAGESACSIAKEAFIQPGPQRPGGGKNAPSIYRSKRAQNLKQIEDNKYVSRAQLPALHGLVAERGLLQIPGNYLRPDLGLLGF